jgi:hypothetical protein
MNIFIDKIESVTSAFLLSSLFFLSVVLAGNATTVKSLDLPELVQQADVIADVTVTNVASFWSAPGGANAIHTRITLQLNRLPLKGQVSSPFYLDFLGGVVGNRAMKVAGIPEPKMGDRLIIFSYAPEKTFVSPIIGFNQGALRVIRSQEDGIDRVYRWWGQPVNESQPFTSHLPQSSATATAEQARTANSVDEFLQRVVTMVHR